MHAKQGIQVISNHFRNALRFVSKRDLDAVRSAHANVGCTKGNVQTIRTSNITSDSQVPMILSSSQPDITHLLLQVVVLARPVFFKFALACGSIATFLLKEVETSMCGAH